MRVCRDRGEALMLRQTFEPVHPGHEEVEDDDVRLELGDLAAGGESIGGLPHPQVRLAAEKFRRALAERRVIVHDEHPQRAGQIAPASKLAGVEEGTHVRIEHAQMSAGRFVGREVSLQNPAPDGRVVNSASFSDLHRRKGRLNVSPFFQLIPSPSILTSRSGFRAGLSRSPSPWSTIPQRGRRVK